MKYFLHSVIHLKKFSIKAGEGTENQSVLIPAFIQLG